MEKHTKEGLKGSWGRAELVEARTKRGSGTSAPVKEELEVYEEFFKTAIKNKRKTRTLVLGGTPELRDLALKYGSETIAVDISPKLLLSLTNIMEYKDSDNNKFMIGDWLEMDKFLPKNSFDVILGDASITNVPFEKWDQLFDILARLLKKKGYIITRQLTYNPSKKLKQYDEIIKDFNKGRNTIFGLVLEFGFYTKLGKKSYDKKKKIFSWKTIAEELNTIKNKLNKKSLADYENLIVHAKYHSSIISSEKEFYKKLRKYFYIRKKGVIKKLIYSHYVPIYLLKVRK